jgi:hypothetical protein
MRRCSTRCKPKETAPHVPHTLFALMRMYTPPLGHTIAKMIRIHLEPPPIHCSTAPLPVTSGFWQTDSCLSPLLGAHHPRAVNPRSIVIHDSPTTAMSSSNTSGFPTLPFNKHEVERHLTPQPRQLHDKPQD